MSSGLQSFWICSVRLFTKSWLLQIHLMSVSWQPVEPMLWRAGPWAHSGRSVRLWAREGVGFRRMRREIARERRSENMVAGNVVEEVEGG